MNFALGPSGHAVDVTLDEMNRETAVRLATHPLIADRRKAERRHSAHGENLLAIRTVLESARLLRLRGFKDAADDLVEHAHEVVSQAKQQ